MDPKCKEEILTTSWKYMRNWMKNKQHFCQKIVSSNPLKALVYDLIKLEFENIDSIIGVECANTDTE